MFLCCQNNKLICYNNSIDNDSKYNDNSLDTSQDCRYFVYGLLFGSIIPTVLIIIINKKKKSTDSKNTTGDENTTGNNLNNENKSIDIKPIEIENSESYTTDEQKLISACNSHFDIMTRWIKYLDDCMDILKIQKKLKDKIPDSKGFCDSYQDSKNNFDKQKVILYNNSIDIQIPDDVFNSSFNKIDYFLVTINSLDHNYNKMVEFYKNTIEEYKNQIKNIKNIKDIEKIIIPDISAKEEELKKNSIFNIKPDEYVAHIVDNINYTMQIIYIQLIQSVLKAKYQNQ